MVDDVTVEAVDKWATRSETESCPLIHQPATRAEREADDAQFAVTVLNRIAEGAPTYTHDDVWEELSRREAAGELPD